MGIESVTAGKWRVDEFHDGELEIVASGVPKSERYGVKGDWAIAKVGDECFWDDPAAEAHDRANAHLFAASKKLFLDGEFLADRLDEFERELQDDEVARQFLGHVAPAVSRFRAALRSALGGEE